MISRFTFVGVVYNNYHDTIDFCQSLSIIEKSGQFLTCVIVDNSDRDDIQKKIDSLSYQFEFVEVLRPPENLGYFGAFNYFFESEFYFSDNTIVLCNNDLIFEKTFCDRYLSSDYPDDVFVLCPDVVTVDGVHQNPHVRFPLAWYSKLKLDLYFSNYYIARFLRLFKACLPCYFRTKKNQASSAGYLHMGIGACYILRQSFLQRFSSLEFPHFLYGEEAYLSKQVHDAAGKLFYDPELKVLHKESATLSTLPSRITYDFGRDGYWRYRSFL